MGDRVGLGVVPGSYAERVLVPAAVAVAVPAAVEARTAAAVLLQGMTAHYLCTSTYPLKPGDTCLVHAAAGGVGLLLVQMAKQRGARVIGTVGTEEKARLAREAGADEVVLYDREDFLAAAKAADRRPRASRSSTTRREGDGREEPRLPRPARHDGLLRQRERPGGPDRPSRAHAQGVALPDAADPRALRRRPREPRAPRRRGARPRRRGHAAACGSTARSRSPRPRRLTARCEGRQTTGKVLLLP